MSLRFERNHQYGSTNIDFRTKKDNKSLYIYQPWRIIKDFGTMGYREYTNPVKYNYDFLNISRKNFNTPDPKNYSTIQYYHRNNIKEKLRKTMFNGRAAQLEETIIGKKPYFGDSDIFVKKKTEDEKKIRNIKRSKSQNVVQVEESKSKTNIPEKKEQKIEKKIFKKEEENYEKFVEGGEEEFKNIDKNRLFYIRKQLRDRYELKNNFLKVYKSWDRNSNKEISVNDCQIMMKDLGIQASDQEILALIRSVNTRGGDTMNIREFSKLIYGNKKVLNLDKKNKKIN